MGGRFPTISRHIILLVLSHSITPVLPDSIWFYMILWLFCFVTYPGFLDAKKNQWSCPSLQLPRLVMCLVVAQIKIQRQAFGLVGLTHDVLRDVDSCVTSRSAPHQGARIKWYGWKLGPCWSIIVGLLWDYNGYSDHSNPIDLDSL